MNLKAVEMNLKAAEASELADAKAKEAKKARQQAKTARKDSRESQGIATARKLPSITLALKKTREASNAAKEAEKIKQQAKETEDYAKALTDFNKRNKLYTNNSQDSLDKPLASHITASKTKKKPTFFSRFKNMFTKRNSNVKVGGKGSQKKRRKNKHKK